VPHLATCIFLFFYDEPELGVEIDPGMALTPLPSSIGQGLNPQPSDHEPSAIPLDDSFCLRNHGSSYLFYHQRCLKSINNVACVQRTNWLINYVLVLVLETLNMC